MAKKKIPGPRLHRLTRAVRLNDAAMWLPAYNGKNFVRSYRKRYGVDLLCAVAELQMLHVPLDPLYIARVRTTVANPINRPARKKERAPGEVNPARDRGGHYCWVCERYRPNERFSGGGHARHICRECQRRPAAEIEQIRLIDHLNGFLRQTVISSKNIDLLVKLCNDLRPEIQCRAEVMLQVARVKPGKRRRVKFLAHHHPELLQQIFRLFDVPDYYCDTENDLEAFPESDDEDAIGEYDFESGDTGDVPSEMDKIPF